MHGEGDSFSVMTTREIDALVKYGLCVCVCARLPVVLLLARLDLPPRGWTSRPLTGLKVSNTLTYLW